MQDTVENHYKWPKLNEKNQFLFKSDFDITHNALADVKATAKCFFELKKKRFYKIQQEEYLNHNAITWKQ